MRPKALHYPAHPRGGRGGECPRVLIEWCIVLYKVCNVKISPEHALIFYFHCVAQYTLSVDSLSSGLKALWVCRF